LNLRFAGNPAVGVFEASIADSLHRLKRLFARLVNLNLLGFLLKNLGE
jgi:hypothetical protein